MKLPRTRGTQRIRVQSKVSETMHKEITDLAKTEAGENVSHMIRILLQESLYFRKYGKPLK